MKHEERGYTEMCEAAEKWYKEGETVGERNGEMKKAKETANELQKMGLSVDKIAKAVKVNETTVRQWLSELPFAT